MTRNNSLLPRLSGGLSLAVLAAALTFSGPSALRAADEGVLTPALLALIVTPIVKTVEGLEQRLAQIETSVGGWADSLMTRRVVVHEICLADDSGAQTCISKGQLDTLIKNVALAEISEPVTPTTQANSAVAAEPIVEPAAEPVTAPAAEPVAVPSEPVSAPQTEANASPATETVVVVVPIEAISIPVTEPNAPAVAEPVVLAAPSAILETEASAPPAAELGVPAAESAAAVAPTETVPATPIALPVDNSQEAQELEHTGTIVPEAPVAPAAQVAPLAEAPAAQITVSEESPGDEYE
jgi:hypothetical protein